MVVIVNLLIFLKLFLTSSIVDEALSCANNIKDTLATEVNYHCTEVT